MKNKFLWVIAIPLLFAACKKDVVNTDPKNESKMAAIGSAEYYEDLYDLHIQTGVYGLVDLVKDQKFRATVIDECHKQFDEDDNVLFKRLNEVMASQHVDLTSAMKNSLNNYGKGELVKYVDGIINGFDYFDSKVYLQVYVPFIESVEASEVPVLATNFDDEPKLEAYYSVKTGILSSITADEDYAKANAVYVISGNESVDNLGEMPKMMKDNFNKGAEITHVNISDKKEQWGNGRADITYIAHHIRLANCTSDAVKQPNSPIAKISNSQLNTWRTINDYDATFASSSTASTYWSPNENIVVVFYEKDRREKFAQRIFPLQYINYNFCTLYLPTYFISKEPIYGVTLLSRGNFHDPNGIGITNQYGPGNVPGASVIFGGSFKIKGYNL